MEVIFEGALSKAWGMPDLLKAVQGVGPLPFGILRLTSADGSVSGKLVVLNGNLIVGATLAEGTLGGYAAARELLLLTQANFAYLNAGTARPPYFEEEISVAINMVLAKLPDLPENAGDLFDEKSLLDKIFGQGDQAGDSTINENVGHVNANGVNANRDPEPSGQFVQLSEPRPPARAAESKAAWSFMQPLLDRADARPAVPELEEVSTRKESLSKLREQKLSEPNPPASSGFGSEIGKLMAWMAIILVVAALVGLAGWHLVKQNYSPKSHSWHTIQKEQRTHPNHLAHLHADD